MFCLKKCFAAAVGWRWFPIRTSCQPLPWGIRQIFVFTVKNKARRNHEWVKKETVKIDAWGKNAGCSGTDAQVNTISHTTALSDEPAVSADWLEIDAPEENADLRMSVHEALLHPIWAAQTTQKYCRNNVLTRWEYSWFLCGTLFFILNIIPLGCGPNNLIGLTS